MKRTIDQLDKEIELVKKLITDQKAVIAEKTRQEKARIRDLRSRLCRLKKYSKDLCENA